MDGQVGDFYISVNEHKKGLRSEKLYVTKDNRPQAHRGQSQCRRAVCWTLSILLIAAAIIIGALIGVGVIDPTSNRGLKDGRSRNIAKDAGLPATANDLPSPVFSEVIQTGSGLSNDLLKHRPEEDLEQPQHFPSGYVTNAYNGRFRITNLAWDRRLDDMTSAMYQELRDKIKTTIENSLIPGELKDKADFFVSVRSFEAGSVVTNFRLGWTMAPSAFSSGNDSILSRDTVLRNFEQSLSSHRGFLASSIYKIDPQSFIISYVPDDCVMMKCGGSCQYKYDLNDFFCTCPDNFVLNSDGVSCLLVSEKSDSNEEASMSTTMRPSDDLGAAEAASSWSPPAQESTEVSTTTTTTTTTASSFVVVETTDQDGDDVLLLKEAVPDKTIGDTEILIAPSTIVPSETTTVSGVPDSYPEEEPRRTTEAIADDDSSDTATTLFYSESSTAPPTTTSTSITTTTTTTTTTTATPAATTDTFSTTTASTTVIRVPEEPEGEVEDPPVTETPGSMSEIEISFPVAENSDKMKDLENMLELTMNKVMAEFTTILPAPAEPDSEGELHQTKNSSEEDALREVFDEDQKPLREVAESEAPLRKVEEEPETPLREVHQESNEDLPDQSDDRNGSETSVSVNISGLDSILAPTIQETLRQVIDNFTRDLASEEDLLLTAGTFPPTTLPSQDLTTPSSLTIDIVGLNITDETELLHTVLQKVVSNVSEEIGSSARPRKISTTSDVSVNALLPASRNCNVSQEFQCSSGGECISLYQRCDGVFDCGDSSDEAACDTWKCPGEQDFTCPGDHSCVSPQRRCDGNADCPQGEDEAGCPGECNSQGDFFCQGQGRCIAKRMVCDGEVDCSSGEDEANCQCSAAEFTCQMGGGCVPRNQVCDGHFDCADRSDEWNCVRVDPEGLLQARLPEGSWAPVCSHSWTESWGRLVCQQLGFTGLDHSEQVPTTNNATFLTVNATLQPGSVNTLQEAFLHQPLDSCPDGVVRMMCHQSSSKECGTWDLGGNVTSLLAQGRSFVQLSSFSTTWPSLVYVVHVKAKRTCTATIIHPQWLLASYSCISPQDLDPLQWVAFGGQSAAQIKLVQGLLPHPLAKLRRRYASHDLLLVHLSEPFDQNQSTGSICLAESAIPQTEPEQTPLCVTAGWLQGHDKPGLSFVQSVDRVAEPHIDLANCNDTTHYNGRLDDSFVCTGFTQGQSQCRTERGSPLMCLDRSSGKWQLQGLLTHRGQCQSSRPHPDLYASVVWASQWIRTTIGLLHTL